MKQLSFKILKTFLVLALVLSAYVVTKLMAEAYLPWNVYKRLYYSTERWHAIETLRPTSDKYHHECADQYSPDTQGYEYVKCTNEFLRADVKARALYKLAYGEDVFVPESPLATVGAQ